MSYNFRSLLFLNYQLKFSQDAWISSWQYFRGFCRKSLPADSRHSNGYALCPSSQRHLSVFIQSWFHTVFAVNRKKQLASRFNLTYRYIDDVLSINNPVFEYYLDQKYPAELEIKDTTESTTSASYLHLLLAIWLIFDRRQHAEARTAGCKASLRRSY